MRGIALTSEIMTKPKVRRASPPARPVWLLLRAGCRGCSCCNRPPAAPPPPAAARS